MLFRTKASAAIDRAEDPRETLDYACAEQQELLRTVRVSLVNVGTSKRQLEHQVGTLRGRLPRFEDEARRAVAAGRDDLARLALQRRRAALQQLEDLQMQVAEVEREEQRVSRTEQELSARIEEFRSRRQVMAARYTAADAQVRVSEALTGVSGDLADLGMALGRAEEKTQRLQARAAALDAMLDPGALGRPVGPDDVAWELRRIGAAQAVESELAAIKKELRDGELGEGSTISFIGAGQEPRAEIPAAVDARKRTCDGNARETSREEGSHVGRADN
jgi:phage shock protein A